MATVHGHHFSVLANTCVRPPVNPETGLSTTKDEREIYDMRNTWNGYGVNVIDGTQEYRGIDTNHSVGGLHDLLPGPHNGEQERRAPSTGLFGKTDSMIGGITAELNNLSDDEFYRKLMQLKNEHQKTLNICEDLYAQKHGISESVRRPASAHDFYENASKNARVRNSADLTRILSTHSSQDFVKDLSPSKPPTGRKTRSYSAKPSTSRSQEFGHVQTDRSSDDEYWKPISAATTDHEMSMEETYHHHHHHSSPYHHENHYSQLNDNESRHSAFSHIEDMWENFSVEEYAPPKEPQRSSSLSRLSKSSPRSRSESSKKEDPAYDWRHRLTVPKPFNMSLRESRKMKEKSRTLSEYEQNKEEERKREQEECQKKFKAKPVPAHVYMPLYDEMTEEQEGKRKFIRENSKEVLKSLEKPFNFMKREEEKKKYRHKKCSSNDKALARAEVQQKPPTGFKAKPFPAHIFDNRISDQLQEEEEYRKIRIQMRAEELLNSANLPPNMESRGKEYTDGKYRQKVYSERAKKAGITIEHKFHPRVNDTIPDFDHLHRRIHSDISQKKSSKEATVCKPFNLRTERIAKKKHQVYEDVAKDVKEMKSRRSFSNFNPSRSANLRTMRSLSTSMDSIPTKMTVSAQLRASANRTKMQQELDHELAELERERQQRLKEKKLKKYIAERAAVNDKTQDLQATLKDKLREYKISERERQEEYRRTLNEIEERIEKRPLLFERTLQANAKKAAEKRYSETLKRAGIDEDYIRAKGKEATDFDLSGDDDDDYTFTQRSSVRSRSRSNSRSRTRSRSRSGSRLYSDGRSDTEHTISDLEHD